MNGFKFSLLTCTASEAVRHFQDHLQYHPLDYFGTIVGDLQDLLPFRCMEEIRAQLIKEVTSQEIKKYPFLQCYGVARIASFFNKHMWSEGFTVTGSPLHDFRKLWPTHHLKYCGIVEEYEAHMQKLAAKLMWLALGSLGVEVKDIKWAGSSSDFQGTQAAVQLNHYPICPEPDRAMGLAAHTDSTLLTILYQNNTAGLT